MSEKFTRHDALRPVSHKHSFNINYLKDLPKTARKVLKGSPSATGNKKPSPLTTRNQTLLICLLERREMKKHASALLTLVIMGLSLNAHALCVNPDGSLDDSSVPSGSVVKDMLPACGSAAPIAAVTNPAPSKNGGASSAQTGLKIIAAAKTKKSN